jgi:hypothetical protein
MRLVLEYNWHETAVFTIQKRIILTWENSLKYSAWQLSFQNVQNLSVKSKLHVEIYYPYSSRCTLHFWSTEYNTASRGLQFECLCRLLSSMGSVLVTIWLLDLLFLMILKFCSLHHLLCTPWHRYPYRTHQFSELYMCIQCNGLFTFKEKIPCAVVHLGYHHVFHIFSVLHHL